MLDVQPHSAEDIGAVVKTYRYLRLGMFLAVVVLFVAILREFQDNDFRCLQTSISAYYFTPVRTILVGVLFVIGFALIVIKGRGLEDIALNFAGIFAPVVAVIPTSDVGTCWRDPPNPHPLDPSGDLAPWVRDNIANNMTALVAGGALALLIAGLILAIERRPGTPEITRMTRTDALLYGTTAAVLGVLTLVLRARWDSFVDHAHGPAAIAMFVFLGVAIGVNAFQDRNRRRGYALAYAGIVVTMAVGAAVILVAGAIADWDHRVFWLEALEISLFAGFWLLQTFQHWRDVGPTGNTHLTEPGAGTDAGPV